MTLASLNYQKAVVNGYTHQLLRIDLSEHTIAIERIADDIREKFVGGRG